jgi:hypothetical protein
MSRPAAATILLALLAMHAGCGGGDDDPGPAAACSASPEVVERALERAPSPVTLEGGARLSDCVARARSNAQLQTTGLVLTRAADHLAERAQRGDRDAALRLGYLVGAARRGAARTPGLQAQLQRRVESAAAFLADGDADMRAALARGVRAGEGTG